MMSHSSFLFLGLGLALSPLAGCGKRLQHSQQLDSTSHQTLLTHSLLKTSQQESSAQRDSLLLDLLEVVELLPDSTAPSPLPFRGWRRHQQVRLAHQSKRLQQTLRQDTLQHSQVSQQTLRLARQEMSTPPSASPWQALLHSTPLLLLLSLGLYSYLHRHR